jgi:hypothetical protein
VTNLIAGKHAPRHLDSGILANNPQHRCTGTDLDVVRMSPDAQKPLHFPESTEGNHVTSSAISTFSLEYIGAISVSDLPAKRPEPSNSSNNHGRRAKAELMVKQGLARGTA